MRVLLSRKRWVAATVGVVVIGTLAAVALGSPPSSSFTFENLVTGKLNNDVKFNSDRVKFQTKDPTYVRVQKIVIGVGGNSGWHHHPGIVIGTVALGTVTFTKSDCSFTTYGPDEPAGAVFVEGGDDPGLASNAGVAPATLYATFVAPNNGPITPMSRTFRIEDDPVVCTG